MMKTSKTKATSKPKKPSKVTKAEAPSKVSKTKKTGKSGTKTKASGTGKPVKSKKITVISYVPSEEEIRKKANEIYLRRLERGEYGTAIDDWHKAEELLKSS
jgi:hypothetical protein